MLGRIQLAGLLIVILLYVAPFVHRQFFEEIFNSEEWKKEINSETEWSSKWKMCKNLIRKHELIGMSANEIIELLGNPNSNNSKEMIYNLGPTGRGINYGTLILFLDDDIVKKIRVTQS